MLAFVWMVLHPCLVALFVLYIDCAWVPARDVVCAWVPARDVDCAWVPARDVDCASKLLMKGRCCLLAMVAAWDCLRWRQSNDAASFSLRVSSFCLWCHVYANHWRSVVCLQWESEGSDDDDRRSSGQVSQSPSVKSQSSVDVSRSQMATLTWHDFVYLIAWLRQSCITVYLMPIKLQYVWMWEL